MSKTRSTGIIPAFLNSMSLAPGARLGVYEIVGLIGAGGMGEVYRARDARLNRDVAAKILPASVSADRDRLERFEQEARAAAALNHPNILSVFDIGAYGGAPYVISELLEGETLRERLSAGALPVRRVVDYAVQLAHGLAAAHEKGIVHRDLKPENIFLTTDDRLKILDFGLAKLTEPEQALAGASNVPTTPRFVTQSGMVLGTMGYAAPEQLRSLAADHRSDIFSFGVILYEMLSGRRAFHGPTVVDTMTAILKDDPVDLPVAERHIPPALARIVDRCLEKSPAARFQSTRDLGFALEGLSSHSGTTVAAIPAVGRRSLWSNPRAGWLVAATCAIGCLAALGLASAWYLSSESVESPELRLQLHAPGVDIPGGGLTSFALSPDGRQFVFVARDGNQPALWLRSLSSDIARPLAGTDGGRDPFWSQDSRSVGFFANGQLKRVDLADGLVRTLASVPNAAGGAWNSEGTILFTRSFAGPIYKIPAGGGEVAAVTRTAPPAHSGHVFPEFLPDGRRFVFFAFGSSDGVGVYLGSLDSQDVRRIAAADAAAVFVPPDRLLLARGDALMSQRVNLESFEPLGESVTVAPNVYIDSINGKAAVSASLVGPVAYRASAPERELVWLNRSGVRTGLAGEAHVAGRVMSLSRDGQHVAVVRRVEGNSDIWTLDLGRGALRRITSHAAHEAGPVWSPDGSQLAFGSDRKSGVLDLYVKKLNGPPETLLIDSTTDKTVSDWSPDGKWIAYTNIDSKTGRDLWAWPLTGDRKPIAIATGPASEVNARFSPDGRWLVFQSNESSRSEIYAQPFPGPGERQQISTEGGSNPQWRRDGRELYLSQRDFYAGCPSHGDDQYFENGNARAALRNEWRGRHRGVAGRAAVPDECVRGKPVAGHDSRQLGGRSSPMMRVVTALLIAACLLPAHALAQSSTRPVRVVLIVDATDAIRQPIGLVRKALTAFVESIDARHELMLVSVAGTPQIRVRPTLDRQQVLKSVNGMFGTSGSNVMHRTIDDVFHRFAQPADRRPVFVVVTAEGFESTQNINPQQITHVTNHFLEHGGILHAVRLNVPTGAQSFRGGNLTELPVSLMIGRDTGGAFTNISPNGLLEVMQRLATVINEAEANSTP